MRRKRRQRLAARDNPAHAFEASEERLELWLAFEQHRAAARGDERRIAHELQHVAESRFAVNQHRAVGERAAVPQRLGKAPRAGAEGVDAPAPRVFLPAARVIAAQQQQERLAEVRLGVLRLQRGRLLKISERFVVAADFYAEIGEVGERRRIVRVLLDLPPVSRDRGLLRPGIAHERGVVLVGLRLGWINLQRFAVAGDRLVDSSLHVQAGAEIVVRLRVARIEPHGVAVARLGVGVAVGRLPDAADRVMRRGRVRRGGDGALRPLRALLDLLRVDGDGGHEAQRAQVVGRAAQHCQAIAPRLVQGPAVIRLLGALKRITPRAGHTGT